MAEKFAVSVVAERLIHNELEQSAFQFGEAVREQFKSGDLSGVYYYMMAALVFSAFSIEAKVNYVGWKTLEDGWPEKANFWEKTMLLARILDLDIDRGKRPWQTIGQLKRLRDTLAHGKPDILNVDVIRDVEPEIWEFMKGQWETTVTPEFVDQCLEDEGVIWKTLLEAAGINASETLTTATTSLKKVVVPNED